MLFRSNLLGVLCLILVALIDIVEQRTVPRLATAALVVEVIVVTALGADVTLDVATGAVHLVASVLLDKRPLALIAETYQSSCHGLFDLATHIETNILGVLLTSFGDM